MGDGREIAIKRLYISGKLRFSEIQNEVDIIGEAQHKNLARYLGCCFTNEDSLLVYEFLPNRSLDLILFGKNSTFPGYNGNISPIWFQFFF